MDTVAVGVDVVLLSRSVDEGGVVRGPRSSVSGATAGIAMGYPHITLCETLCESRRLPMATNLALDDALIEEARDIGQTQTL